MANKEEIRMLCKRLNLFHLAKIKSFDVDIKNKDDYLKYLLEYEIEERNKSVASKLKKSSNMPSVDLNYKFTGIDKWNVDEVKKLTWLDETNNLVLVGKCGCCKTTLSVILGTLAINNKNKVYYLKQDELLACFKEKEENVRAKKLFNKLKEADLIIIDEMMYLPISESDVITLYKGLMYLNDSRSLILITNRRLEEWLSLIDDKHTMETLVSRITLNARTIVFK